MIGFDDRLARAHASMALRTLVLALGFSIVADVRGVGATLLLTSLRLVIAAVVLLPFVWRAGETLPAAAEAALYGLLGLFQAAFYGGMFWAAQRIGAVSMSVLYVSVPFVTFCLGLVFGVERPSASLAVTLAIGAGGALLLTFAQGGPAHGAMQLRGAELVYFGGCVALAFYSVLTRWGLSRDYLSGNAAVRSFWSILVGALLVGALGLFRETPQALLRLMPKDLLSLAYLGAVSTAGTVWLLQKAAPILSPATAMAYSYAPSFVSMALLAVTDPASISWRWLPGSGLILLAMALLLRRDFRRSRGSSVREGGAGTSMHSVPSSVRSTGV